MDLFDLHCMRKDPITFEIGDTVKVYVKIREGEKERIQMFEGTVIARRGSGVSETFTVRRVSYGVGVERVFPVNAPAVDRIEVVRHPTSAARLSAAAWVR